MTHQLNHYIEYVYKAVPIKVYDGDTITVLVDLGFKIKHELVLRLEGIDAPEVKGKDKERGREVRDWLSQKIMWQNLLIKTKKDKKGKYGRYIARIYYEDGHDIIAEMLEAFPGIVKKVDYK